MSLLSTPAVVLHGFKYSESSKIVRLATRELGVQSAIAKGAMRPKSKFGATLQVLSEGVAQLYVKPNRELHTLAEFEVTRQHVGLARDVKRYAAAGALTELIMRSTLAEPNPEVYHNLVIALDRLAAVPGDEVDAESLSVLWQTVSVLGFSPSLDSCARDGRRLPDAAANFSIADGGFLCSACASGVRGTVLQSQDRTTLESLVSGDQEAVPKLSGRNAAAHRRLLARFIRRHLAEERELKALDFWETL
jgi:DNA repair protein RecO (recombination protein O)